MAKIKNKKHVKLAFFLYRTKSLVFQEILTSRVDLKENFKKVTVLLSFDTGFIQLNITSQSSKVHSLFVYSYCAHFMYYCDKIVHFR